MLLPVCPTFVLRLATLLACHLATDVIVVEIEETEYADEPAVEMKTELELEEKHMLEARQIDAAAVDRSARILPGVKRFMDSARRPAVCSDSDCSHSAKADSASSVLAHGCMTRVGGVSPP